ncbi:hypothetical protein ACOME3_003769 [Neoechinorhynchus agilis]
MTRRLYRILNVPSNASSFEIKRSYRALALKYHPDKCREQNAEDQFKQISEAYEVLIDPLRRSAYDRGDYFGLAKKNVEKEQDASGHKTSQRSFKADVPSEVIFVDDDDDLYSRQSTDDLFRRPNKGPVRRTKECAPSYHELRLTLKEMVIGGTKRMKVRRWTYDERSKSFKSEEKEFNIIVSPGWRNGTKIRFSGEGDTTYPDLRPSDMVFVVVEEPHNAYSRQGDDIIHTVTLPLRQALCSQVVKVKTVDSKLREIQLLKNEIITPSTVKLLIGDGMPRMTAPTTRGNMIIKFQIEFPLGLSSDIKSKLAIILTNDKHDRS